MENKRKISFRVSEEEYRLIVRNQEKAGFAKLSPFIISSCSNRRGNGIPMRDLVEANVTLQEIKEKVGGKEISELTDRIFSILNEGGGCRAWQY